MAACLLIDVFSAIANRCHLFRKDNEDINIVFYMKQKHLVLGSHHFGPSYLGTISILNSERTLFKSIFSLSFCLCKVAPCGFSFVKLEHKNQMQKKECDQAKSSSCTLDIYWCEFGDFRPLAWWAQVCCKEKWKWIKGLWLNQSTKN